MGAICLLGNIYFFVLIARAVLSWFPPSSPDGALAQVTGMVFNLTEPVLAPVRRMLPAMGVFDLSFLVVIFGLQIVLAALGCRVGI